MSQSLLSHDLSMKIIKEKQKQLYTIMKKYDIDCWLIYVRETSVNTDPILDYIVGGEFVWESAFIFNIHGNDILKIAIVGNFDAPAEEKKGIWNKVIPYKEGISSPLIDVMKEINPRKIALNYSTDDVSADGLTYGLYTKLSTILGDMKEKFIPAKPIITALRGKKTQVELDLIKKACEITENINKSISSYLEPGMSEIYIQRLFRKEMRQFEVSEAWQKESCPAIDAGPNKEHGHIGPSPDNAIKNGHTLHNDFGIRYQGYCSDLQRMWYFGKKEDIPPELIHAFDTVKSAIIKASEVIKPGVMGKSVDKVARDFIISNGYEEFAHALGHQVGRQAHDGGVLLGPLWERYGDTPKGIIEEGNVFTLELYVKTKNYGTVALEEMIHVTKDGCKFLVPTQKEFICVNESF